MTGVPAETIREDRRLEQQTEQSREALARLRWHWTLDQSNPKRVPIREYARAVGRGEATIRHMTKAYAEWAASGARRTGTLDDYIARQRLRSDTVTAAEAVAKAKGITLDAVRRHHAQEVREVKAIAEERVERANGAADLADEARKVAEGRVKGAAARKRIEDERRRAHTFRYLKVEGHIGTARHNVLAALKESEGVEFTDEEREWIAHAANELRAIVQLIDLRIIGDTTVDWDAELAKLADQ